MNELLKLGQTVYTESSKTVCKVEQFLGGGSQGEVYRAELAGAPVALKWYFPSYLKIDEGLRNRLERTVKAGAPSDKFLWPLEVVSAEGVAGFGYIMPLREPRFKNIVDLMRRRIEPSFRALATAGFELAHCFHQLHAKGLCYHDINFGNVFFDPNTGDIRVCDNDNVDVNREPGAINGTPRFMAPEIVRGEATPTYETDVYSLAVLLFYMLTIHHPLEGKKEASIHAFDQAAMTKLYGTDPVFIFDLDDDSNRPVPGYHDNALAFWPIYPKFLRDLFTKAFTKSLRVPSDRVVEGQWRSAMVSLRDAIFYCPHCSAENFYDAEASTGTAQRLCLSCKKELRFPARISIASTRSSVMLNRDTQLYPHHLDDHKRYDFSKPMAAVARHPTDPKIWGLRNLGSEKWTVTLPDGALTEVEPGRSVTLAKGVKINLGTADGEIVV